jgi:cancer susceptibility candidate protein 1
MRCNGLPNANDPSDLRKYIHMWQDDVRSLNRREINWLLKTNEQSILTQDQNVIDLSRANLKKLQPEIGLLYAKRANEVLGILEEMDAVIRDRYALSPSKMEDLLDVSFELCSCCDSSRKKVFSSSTLNFLIDLFVCFILVPAKARDTNRAGVVYR